MDEFGDDDLDTIPDNTLQQLEQTAFTSTQRQKNNAFSAPQNPKIQTYGATGLSRTGNANKNVWRPPQPRKGAHSQVENAPPASAPEPPSSDYGFDDEDIVDLDEPSTVAQPTSGLPTRSRQQTPARPAPRNARHAAKATLDPETEAAFAAADAELRAQRPGPWAQAPHLQPKPEDGVDVSSLQARIAELEAEQARLRQAEQDARNAALAKQGEITIVRSNQEKATKEYERRIEVMQRLHTEESTKQKAELEAGRKEREKMQTDNRFLQHDLDQEAERAKRLNGPGKARVAPAGTETPKKTKRTTQGDGFEDDEVRLVSPSKSREKSREQTTPKVGAKRKRPAQDSPVPPLSFSRPPRVVDIAEQQRKAHASQTAAAVAKETVKYTFIQRMLNHRPYEGHDRSVETLAKHFLPSDAGRSLSSLLTEGITSRTAADGGNLPLRLSHVSLKLWGRCLEEKYYPPIYLLLDMVQFAVRLELSPTVSRLIEEAVPICMRTIERVANSVARVSIYPSHAATPEFEAYRLLAPHIDVDETLDFLRQLCDAATLSTGYIQLFWQKMDFQSVLLMLNKAHPISQITAILQILATSALPTTFGPICVKVDGAADEQAKEERTIIERLTALIFEKLEAPKDEPAYSDVEIVELRIEILNVFNALCLTDHGGLLLAQHRTVIGRLIRFLDAQVHQLYTTRPSVGQLDRPSSRRSLHTLIAQIINTIVRTIYHLLRTYDSNIILQNKLAVVKGGYHKFLVSMTRIAFSDKLVFEEGLDEEVVEAAHQILDSVLSPEEGEAVVRAVETPRGTKGSSTEENTQETNIDDGMEEEPG